LSDTTDTVTEGEVLDRRDKLATYAAWSAFGVGVFVLAIMSLYACNLSLLRGFFPDQCGVAADFGPAPISPLIDEVRRMERQLALTPACETPQQHAEAEPVPACPEPPPEEVVLSVDLSLSMEFCISTPVQRDRELDALQRRMAERMPAYQYQQLEDRYNALQASMTCAPPQRRLDSAKRALSDLASNARSSTAFIMQSFNACDRAPVTHGRYDRNQRDSMIAQINAMRAGPNTNLAAAITAAAAQVRGGRSADAPASIVIVSDGQDNCGGDPCAAARQVKVSLPFTKIHVVSVGGDAAMGRCIANATGGTVISARETSRLVDAIAEASGENMPEACRTR
jgi:hypothetical protein